MSSYKNFTKRIKAFDLQLVQAIIDNNLSEIETILKDKNAAPFNIRIVKLHMDYQKDDVSFETLINKEELKPINDIILATLDEVILQRNFDPLFSRKVQYTFPLKPALSKHLTKRRFLALSGMHFPYLIQVLPPKKSVINLSLEHFNESMFTMILNSPHMNAFNLLSPGKADSPLTIAINQRNTIASKMILDSEHLSLALLGKNKRSLKSTATGRAVITGQLNILKIIINRTRELYKKQFNIDCFEQAMPMSIFYQDPHLNSLFSLAAEHGQDKIMQWLLQESGEKIKSYPSLLINAMNAAIDANQADSIEVLMNTGWYPLTQRELLNYKERAQPELRQYLLRAIDSKNPESIKALANCKLIQAHCLNRIENGTFLLKAVSTGSLALVKATLEYPAFREDIGSLVNQCLPESNLNALHIAIHNAFIDVCEYLSNQFPQLLLKQDAVFHTPVYHAVKTNNIQILQAILNEKTIDQSVAREISFLLQHPAPKIREETINFMRNALIEYDRTHHFRPLTAAHQGNRK